MENSTPHIRIVLTKDTVGALKAALPQPPFSMSSEEISEFERLTQILFDDLVWQVSIGKNDGIYTEFIDVKVKDRVAVMCSLKDLLRRLKQIELARPIPGFEQMLDGLNNPTQFNASEFELEILEILLKRHPVSIVEMGKAAMTPSGEKRPDFHLGYADLPLWIECKRFGFQSGRAASQFSELEKKIGTPLLNLARTIPNARLDISFTELATGRAAQLLEKIEAFNWQIGETLDLGPWKLAMTTQGQPLSFSEYVFLMTKMSVGNTYRQINEPNDSDVVFFANPPKAKSQLRRLIVDAIEQLPPDAPGVVCVECPKGLAEFASNFVRARLDKNLNPNLLGGIFRHSGGALMGCRNSHRELLIDVWKGFGFQPSQ